MLYVDYSSTVVFGQCPLKWFEKYVLKRTKRWVGQRKDALAIGGATHAVLEFFHRHHHLEFPPAVLEKYSLTPEAEQMVRMLTVEYVRGYGVEGWKFIGLEEPLTAPTTDASARLVAKLDGIVEVGERCEVQAGMEGEVEGLDAGVYGKEIKTKDEGVNRGLWMQQWHTNLQASFQQLVLEAAGYPVQGIIVDVLDKPKVYVPKRKCKGCKETSEMSAYVVGEGGQYSCPWCGHPQELKPYTQEVEKSVGLWRMVVRREREVLEAHRTIINGIVGRMTTMIMDYPMGTMPNLDLCVEPRFGRQCDYYNLHIQSGGRLVWPGPQGDALMPMGFEEAEDYVGGGLVGWVEEG